MAIGMRTVFASMSSLMVCSPGSPCSKSESGRLLLRMNFLRSTCWRCLLALAMKKEIAFPEVLSVEGESLQ